MKAQPIYVEILIKGAIDDVWRLTQTPDLHRRWDLRFTDIEYLPRPDPAQPQRFLYATRIGFGLRIGGEGESVGQKLAEGTRASALRFWSNDPKSLIAEGSGYWQYVRAGGGLRFLTRYDYRTRFGRAGAVVDRVLFRPLLGWATAWSFDRLRLWIEAGVDPETSMQRSIVHFVARAGLSLTWLYQGLVPKLIWGEASGELATVKASGLFDGFEHRIVMAAGIGEMLLGASMLALWRVRLLFPISILVLALLATAAAIAEPGLYIRQFNPATLTLAMAALAVIGWVSGANLPTAARCLRRERPSP